MSSNGDNNEQIIRCYDVLDRINDILADAQRPRMSPGKRMVDYDEMADVLSDLRAVIPIDIRSARNIIISSDQIFEDAEAEAASMREKAQDEAKRLVENAQMKADNMLADAQMTYDRLVSQESVYTEAKRLADIMVKNAERTASTLYDDAKVYCDSVLSTLINDIDAHKERVISSRKKFSMMDINTRVETVSDDDDTDFDGEYYDDDNGDEDSSHSEGIDYGFGGDSPDKKNNGAGFFQRIREKLVNGISEYSDDTVDDSDDEDFDG